MQVYNLFAKEGSVLNFKIISICTFLKWGFLWSFFHLNIEKYYCFIFIYLFWGWVASIMCSVLVTM